MSRWYVIDPQDTDYRCADFAARPTAEEVRQLAEEWELDDGDDIVVAYRAVTFEVGRRTTVEPYGVADTNELQAPWTGAS